jgi:PKD repeat protein
MKKYIIVGILGLLFSFNTYAITKKVLFIGNSLMSYGNTPLTTQSIATANGDVLNFDNYTHTGVGFKEYWTDVNPNPHDKIKLGGWDYVVMNEFSNAAIKTPALIQADTYNYAALFQQEISQYNPAAKIMFFMNWGYRDGYSQLVSSGTSGGDGVTYTSLTMSNKIESVYRTMATANNAALCGVGAVWRAVQAAYPSYNLYLSVTDGKHPNALGTYIAAMTTYTSIFRKDPTISTYIPSTVPTQLTLDGGTVAPATFVANVNAIVKTLIYDNLSSWNIGTYDPAAGFDTYTAIGNEVTLTNTTTNGISYVWDFGDGTTSTSANPTHIYSTVGSYNITLTATGYAGYTSVISKTVNTVNVDPLRPIKSVSTSALSGMNYKVTLGPSEATSFTVGGANLLDNLTLTTTGNFEIKREADPSYTQSPIVLVKNGDGSIPATTILVRLKAGLAIGSNNGNIAISSSDFTTANVTLAGTVAENPPRIYVANLTDFTATTNIASTEQSFLINGHDLTDNIVISASANYQISTGTGVGFVPTNPIILSHTDGSLGITPIYVRLKAGLSVKAYNEIIQIRSGGAEAIDMKLSGVVNLSTSIPNANSNNPNIVVNSMSDNRIRVSGMNIGSIVTVLNTNGQEVNSEKAQSNELIISVPAKGMYIIKVLE